MIFELIEVWKLGFENGFWVEIYLCSVDNWLAVDFIGRNGQIFANIFDCFLAGEGVPGNDWVGVDLLADKLLGAFEELGGEDDDGGGTVTNLVVLLVGNLAQELRRRVLDIEQLQNCGAVIGNSGLASLVDQHFVQTDWAEGWLKIGLKSPKTAKILTLTILAMAETAVTFSERTDWPDFRSPASTNRSDVFAFILRVVKSLVGSSSLFSLRFSVQ